MIYWALISGLGVIIMLFKDRIDAGESLARLLKEYKGKDVIVYALPRGGVILGRAIADYLNAPLRLKFVKKIGHPNNPEYGVCALGECGELVCNDFEIEDLDKEWLNKATNAAEDEIKRQKDIYLKGEATLDPRGKIVILVDDGIATGLTMAASIKDIKKASPKEIIVAIPVVPLDTAKRLRRDCEKLVAVKIESYYLGAVGMYYLDFKEVSDREVMEALYGKEGD